MGGEIHETVAGARRPHRTRQAERTTLNVWVVLDEDHPETPLAGVWRTLEGASEHCPPGYVILKMELDSDVSSRRRHRRNRRNRAA